MKRNTILMRREILEAKENIDMAKTMQKEEPGELVLFMASSEDRKASNVRWSVQRDIFRTGNYPQLNWNLYDCHPDQDKSQQPTPEMIFRYIKELGHGSFGKVMLVELKLTGERLAMKEMNKDECPKSLRTKELYAFVQIGSSPFVVRFHSCFQTDKACYLLMQYHCGGSLAKIIEEFGPLCENTTRFFTAEVVEGLLHLHNRGIIHRDIKLANILLGVDNHVRICDLGLCKLGMTGKARTHTRCGALRYCAPEVLSKEWYAKEVDWWSLGVVIYRLLTGQYPFDGDSRFAIEELIKNNEPVMKDLKEGPAKDIIMQFLKKKPNERLGYGDLAGANIRTHVFFQEINWDQLQARQAKAPSVQKRFMRRGSMIRRLAFWEENPDVSRTRLYIGLFVRLAVLLLVGSALVYAVLFFTRESSREKALASFASFSVPIKNRLTALWSRVPKVPQLMGKKA